MFRLKQDNIELDKEREDWGRIYMQLTFVWGVRVCCVWQIYRESTGSATLDDTTYGDPVQKAEAMAFRRACARFGLGLHLYHEDML